MEIVSYANSSYATDLEDKKLITGYYSFFDREIVI